MAPFVLKFKGNKSFSPLSQISDAETLTRTWKVCTKVAAHLEQGQRLENLSWRLWFLQIALVQADNAKQKREFKKFSKGMSDKLDKDKGRSIHELQAPNFKRTDSTDKVRLRVEEMAHQRDSGPGGIAGGNNGNGGRFANDPDAAAAHYMKGMQYTFAVDPRVKPLATTAMPAGEEVNMTAAGNKGRAGGAMMGKMRVRPMHPPPVPARAQQGQGPAKDASGDTTMHISTSGNNTGGSSVTVNGNNATTNEHAMDVSDDHGHHHRMDEDYRDQQRSLERVQEGAEYEQQRVQHHQDDDFQFDTDPDVQLDGPHGAKNDHEDGDPDGAGHHTPTPQHLLLPSHHPSALPYPPPPPTLANAHALSNALSGSGGLFIPGSSNASNSTSMTPRGASYANSSMNMNLGNTNLNSHYNGSNMNMNGYRPGQHQNQGQTHPQPNIIRFPTIFSSDFGPTSLLCALPTNSNSNSSGPSFSFESTTSPGPSANAGGGYQSFSALGAGTNGHGQTSSSVTTQGIYGPNGGIGMGMNMGRTNGGLSGIGVGMQNAETSFDFGVPRPTFEFPIEEILKGEGIGGESGGGTGNGNSGAGMTSWDQNNLNTSLNLLGDSVFGMGPLSNGVGQWSVQPQEIHSPTEPTSPSKGMSVFQATIPSRQSSLSATVAYGNVTTGVATNHEQQARNNSLSPSSVHSNTSNSHAQSSNGPGHSNAANVKSEGLYEGGGGISSGVSQSSGSATVGQQMSGGATASGSILGGSGGVGSVVPGNVGNTAPGGVKSECANCGATHTPLWRRGLNDELNCNACGLYCKLHKRARPKNLRTSHGDRTGNAWGAKAGDAELAGEPVQCHNCATMATPLWRKDDEGNTLCNACGLYLKLHGNRRPLSMKSDVIRKRSRHETEKRTSVSSIITVMTPANNLQNSRRNSPTPPPSAGSSSSGPEPFIEQTAGSNNNDPMAFPFGQDLAFGGDSDYMSGFGMGMGADLTSYASFGSYVYSDANSSASSMGGGNGLASPTSPTELQHIVETTVMAGVENGGGHAAPSAKRRRMTLESTFSGSSLAHTSGGTNSAHSSPIGSGQKGHGNSPPYFSLDATINNANNGMNSSSTGNTNHVDQSGHMSPTRSSFGNNSPPQPANSMSGITYDFYGYPIHPPMAPLHPPSLIHPHSMMWGEPPLQHTPTQSSMSHARSHSHSLSRSPSHSRRPSHSHSRSNSHNITMPLYLYDGGASSRAYEGANAATPTATGNSTNNPTDEELFSSGFDLFTDHGSMDENRVHYGPTGGI